MKWIVIRCNNGFTRWHAVEHIVAVEMESAVITVYTNEASYTYDGNEAIQFLAQFNQLVVSGQESHSTNREWAR